ncbi:ornithine cyclodeaminase family protein [Aestuariibius sp. HNIBRBA575]|uniref:ornithine cyclodeaminase family protein n=1 Tax=Aestuariibius sp. HNIBRBA575 TaxID=3233343 RepID=UPI0034A12995
MTTFVPFDPTDQHLTWTGLTDALEACHALPPATVDDVFLYQDDNTLLNRSAWIPGLGLAVKCATIFPGNPANGKPMIGGAVNLFSDKDGALEAIVDFHLVTKWKTAGDSALAARKLARPDSKNILIMGAGTVGRTLRSAYGELFPDAQFTIWNRSASGAEKFAAQFPGTKIAADLETAVGQADIVTSATMSTQPILDGAWLKPGQHIDLIGAYRPDMREANDIALLRSRVFVDNRTTVLDHIGELKIPLAEGVITRDHVVADYYQMDLFQRQSDDEITLFKNGGGAHLDLMTSRHILQTWMTKCSG